jgi:hypothetical protein
MTLPIASVLSWWSVLISISLCLAIRIPVGDLVAINILVRLANITFLHRRTASATGDERLCIRAPTGIGRGGSEERIRLRSRRRILAGRRRLVTDRKGRYPILPPFPMIPRFGLLFLQFRNSVRCRRLEALHSIDKTKTLEFRSPTVENLNPGLLNRLPGSLSFLESLLLSTKLEDLLPIIGTSITGYRFRGRTGFPH